MQKLKLSNYIAKNKIFFYLQLVLFATIPLLSIRYLRVNLFGSSFPIFFVLVITGICIFFFTRSYYRELRIDRNTFLFITLLLLFAIYQLVNSFGNGLNLSSIDETLKTFSSLIVFVFIFYFLRNTIFNDPYKLNQLFKPLILFSTVILIVLIIYYYFYFNSKYLGITLEFRTELGKNQLALYLGMIFPIVLNNFINKRNILNFIFLFVHSFAIIYVDSKGVLFCLFLSYMLTFIFLNRRPILQFLTISGFFCVFLILFFNFIFNFSSVINKLKTYNTITDVHLYKSNEMREILATKSMFFFNSAPIFGLGTNEFLNKVGVVTHNSYLQILCEQGIVGFTIFLLLIVVIFYVIRIISKKGNRFERSIIISSLVPIFYFIFINAYNLILIYIFWSILFILNNYHLKNDSIQK